MNDYGIERKQKAKDAAYGALLSNGLYNHESCEVLEDLHEHFKKLDIRDHNGDFHRMRCEIVMALALFIKNFQDMQYSEMYKFIEEELFFSYPIFDGKKIYKLKVELTGD